MTRGAILAGGAASRFGGKAKGLETVGGERILDRVVRVVKEAVGELPLLVANADDAHEWIEGAVVAKDVIPNCGTLGGIYSAVAHSQHPVLITAWDMPFVNLELLKAVIAGASAFDVFLPESNGPLGFEPLCGVYSPACAEPIKAALDDEDFRSTSFHEHVRVSTLPLSDVRTFGDPDMLFFNVNSPSDVAKAEQLWQTQSA
ncbi:MAG: molybdenum cofactor guanylyltransferase [Gemmatimonadales bacterium]